MNPIIIGFNDDFKEVEIGYGLGQEYENKSNYSVSLLLIL
jgi:hypothetical protein